MFVGLGCGLDVTDRTFNMTDTFPRYSCLIRTILIMITACAAILLPRGAVGEAIVKFNYTDGPNGPAQWGGICQTGTRQSPIDIVTSGLMLENTLQKLARKYVPADATVLLNTERLQLEVEGNSADGFGTLTLQEDDITDGPILWKLGATQDAYGGDDTYTLTKFHFHAPSEHTVDNRSYPLELHLFHSTPSGKKAVVAVLFKEGHESEFLAEFWNFLPTLKDHPKTSIDITKLPLDSSYARYQGSLTTPTPTCAENVTWVILLNDDIQMSSAQVAAFKAAFPAANNRPIQPLNNRTVVTYGSPRPPGKSSDSPILSAVTMWSVFLLYGVIGLLTVR